MINLDFNKMNGLAPAVVQDANTLEVLMLGFMNRKAFEKTLETGRVVFWSRTRKALWMKGETTGNFLFVDKILVDCDLDTILIMAFPNGPTCHTGRNSCFQTKVACTTKGSNARL